MADRYALVKSTAAGLTRTYVLLPNDSLPGDSVLNHLGSGVKIWTQPGGEYLLEVETDAEEMELNRFEMPENGRIRTSARVTAGECDGERCAFSFSGGTAQAFWLAALSVDGGRNGATGIRSVRFGGEGTNSARLPVTILFLGRLTGLPSDSARAEFAENLVARMNGHYAGTGVEVSLRGWRRGSGHPVAAYAKTLSDTATFFFDDSSWKFFWNAGGTRELHGDALSEGWSDEDGAALEIAVVEAIDDVGIVGISPLPGISLEAGRSSVAVVGVQAMMSNGSLVPNSREQIAYTMAHEVGHFLGLRHTTATWEDRKTFFDYSMHDDGLSDTPFDYLCEAGTAGTSFSASLTGTAETRVREALLRPDLVEFSASPERCPDRNNLMFPYIPEDSAAADVELSPSQGLLMRTNLRLLPH